MLHSYITVPFLLLLSYQRLLQTIGVLEAQRTQAILDLETLGRHQKQALGDPITFVDQLQKQVQHQLLKWNNMLFVDGFCNSCLCSSDVIKACNMLVCFNPQNLMAHQKPITVKTLS